MEKCGTPRPRTKQPQNDEGGAFPLVRRASSSDMTCYSAVHLLHFYVSKSLHSYAGGVRNTADLILIEG